MAPAEPQRLSPEPPPRVQAALRKRLAGRDLEAMNALFALRRTAQQVDNAVTEWLVDVGGSIARFQVLAILWASGDDGAPHKEIVASLGVTRATVSGLMAALQRDGFVESTVDPADRRNQIANLTDKGRERMDSAFGVNAGRVRGAFSLLSRDELATFTELLQRIRQGFASSGGE